MAVINEILDDEMKKPRVEKFPVNYYEEKPESFYMFCYMRQSVAIKHFFGEVDYTMYDLVQKFKFKGSDNI